MILIGESLDAIDTVAASMAPLVMNALETLFPFVVPIIGLFIGWRMVVNYMRKSTK